MNPEGSGGALFSTQYPPKIPPEENTMKAETDNFEKILEKRKSRDYWNTRKSRYSYQDYEGSDEGTNKIETKYSVERKDISKETNADLQWWMINLVSC